MKFNEFVDIKKNKLCNTDNINNYFTICKRENNSKRNFIIVQNFLGKHVPKHPSEITKYFDKLAKAIIFSTHNKFSKDSLILDGKRNGIIYFAETALAIGEYLSNELKIDYAMHTTREKRNKKVFMKFTEDHCHAPDHIIYGDKNEVKKLNRILIVDDEITSGNTIEKVIDKILEINPKCEISIASFINLMKPERQLDFFNKKIKIISLVKGKIKDNAKLKGETPMLCSEVENYKDSYLVLGTEENMYNALMAACRLEKQGYDVYFHASTRSPIVASNEMYYSLRARYNFPSAEDYKRSIYIYNLNNYKQIFVFRNGKNELFDSEAETLLKRFSELPIKFYNYKEDN